MRLIAALLAASFAVPASGLAQLLPAGDFQARDGRPGLGMKYRLDDLRGQALATDMNAIAAKTPIAIDYDHQTMLLVKNGAKAPAAGWIQAVEWRKGEGLFAKVEWTPAATAHIAGGEYRYISPVLFFDERTGDINQVAMASLVNVPGIVGMEPVVAALAAFTPGGALAANTPNTTTTPEPDMAILAALCTLLALPAATDEAGALAAVTALKATADTPPAKASLPAALSTALGLAAGADEAAALSALQALKTPDTSAIQAMQAMQGQIAALTAQINGEKLNATVDSALAEGKLLPAQKAWALDLGRSNMAALSSYLATAVPMAGLQGQSNGKGAGDAGLDKTETAALATDMARAFGLTAEQFAKGAPAATH